MGPIRSALGAACLVLVGCATVSTAETPAPPDQVEVLVYPRKPPPSSIRLVMHAPSREHYRFLGKVSGEAPAGDLVAAAKMAHDDLLGKAAALGADVVKIDVIRPPSDRATGSRILLAGRAYKSITD